MEGNKSKIGGMIIFIILVGVVIYLVMPLFAVKKVTNTLDEAREKAYLNSANGLVDATRLLYMETLSSENSDKTSFDGKTNLLDKLRISGQRPESGVVYMNKNEEIYVAVIYENTCFSKDFKEQFVTVKDKSYCQN